MRRNRHFGTLAIFLLASSLLLPAATLSVEHAQEQRYLQDLKILAAPDMEGRGAGTAGLERASAYIAREFKQLALQPVGENGPTTRISPSRPALCPGIKTGSCEGQSAALGVWIEIIVRSTSPPRVRQQVR